MIQFIRCPIKNRKKLLSIILFLTILSTKNYCQNSVDIYLEGLSECLEKEQFKILAELFTEIDTRIVNVKTILPTDNPYFDFSLRFCEETIDDRFFEVEKDSKLDSLIKEVLKYKYWYIDIIDFDKPLIIDGQEVEIIPPAGTPPPPAPEAIEKIHLKPESVFIRCSMIFTLNRVLSTYYQRYELIGIASAKVKLCGLYELLEQEDFKLNAVKYFIAIDVVLQKILHQNKYEGHIE